MFPLLKLSDNGILLNLLSYVENTFIKEIILNRQYLIL